MDKALKNESIKPSPDAKSPIAREVSRRLATLITVVTILVGTASYFYSMASTEQLVREQLVKYIGERGLRESVLFLEAKAYLERFQREYIERYKRMGDEDPIGWFKEHMEKGTVDGTYRTKRELYYGKDRALGRRDDSSTAAIGSVVRITPDVRRAFAIGYDMVVRYGPAWRKPFLNLYFASTEKIAMDYWPGTPWGLIVDDKVEWRKEEWFTITTVSQNPERQQRWSGILYDARNGNWMISGVIPLDIDGKQVGLAGTDLPLDELVKRTINEASSGTYNILLQADGRVIAHPHMVEEIIASKGQLNAKDVADGHLSRIYKLALTAAFPGVIDNVQDGEFLAVTKIEGPEWYFITVYPKSLLKDKALWAAGFTFLSGLISIVIVILATSLILKRSLVKPLGRLTQTIRDFEIDDTQAAIQFDAFVSTVGKLGARQDEIGLLATSFGEMGSNLQISYSKLDESRRDLRKSHLDLSASFAFLDAVISESPVGITIYNEIGDCIAANQAIADLVGASESQLLEQNFRTIESWKESGLIEAASRAFDENERTRIEIEVDSTFDRHVLFDCQLVPFQNGDKRNLMVMFSDITKRKKAEAEQVRLQCELQQTQKMEALGQLTGGIAHDFNNILGIILGYSELAMARSTSRGDAKQAKQLELILKASERAKGLVAKMLAFSRSEASNDTPLLLQSILMEDIKMLRSTLPSSIEISTEIDESLPAILMDPVQLNQLLMNLCINARDAMDGKGNINIRLAWSREMEGERVACRKRIEGDWVELSITDTGSGIKPDVLDRIFDPFYTTKDVGKGTGMGLSVIHGIMRNHGGHILVETEIGKGSTFRLLFPPAIEEIAKTPGVDRSSEKLPHGRGEHVLILDDEQDLGEYLGDLLESYGYRVTVLTNSKEALDLFKEKPDEFAILITDQTMPGMTGVALVNAIREIRPDMPSILNTGFSDDIDAETATGMGMGYLEKPVKANSLLQKIDELIRSKRQSTE